MVMESNTQNKSSREQKNKKSTIDSKKTSKKKHSATNDVKEYGKQAPAQKSSIIEAEIMNIKNKSFAGDEDKEKY